MKYIFSYSVKPAIHFLAKRKPNVQVNKLLSELFPHVTEVTCTQHDYENFIDLMFTLGFVVNTLDQIKVDSKGNVVVRTPVTDVA